ncbi:TetR family transcriptional regulator C-terminal domain-containing protein [Tunturiibacter lichenicola]|uniref:TetR family transcriptional regulator C-terminal domain-containing protein n=1 Tax=Tunturiibacter lichenicola TaxID=2051959 RepID=UPI003D9B460A
MSSELKTREHLIEVGLKQLHLSGYTATGVKEVLDLAGVPKGSFYHYFPSKETFAVEVLQRYADQEARRAQRVLGDVSVPPLKRLRTYFEELIRVYGPDAEISGCLIGNLSLEVADHSAKLQNQLHTVFVVWQSGVAGVLREAIELGELKRSTDPDALAEFLLNSYEGALVRMKADKSKAPLEIFLRFAFEVLLKK